jgi:hypothetical protein
MMAYGFPITRLRLAAVFLDDDIRASEHERETGMRRCRLPKSPAPLMLLYTDQQHRLQRQVPPTADHY